MRVVPRAFGLASHTGFLSGRLISSNEGTWVLFHHDSSAAPADRADRVTGVRFQELCFSAFVLGAAIASDNCRHSSLAS
jgi:hypothetical protein